LTLIFAAIEFTIFKLAINLQFFGRIEDLTCKAFVIFKGCCRKSQNANANASAKLKRAKRKTQTPIVKTKFKHKTQTQTQTQNAKR
jgi:hypothetical protein